jgi:hypothetical protein
MKQEGKARNNLEESLGTLRRGFICSKNNSFVTG